MPSGEGSGRVEGGRLRGWLQAAGVDGRDGALVEALYRGEVVGQDHPVLLQDGQVVGLWNHVGCDCYRVDAVAPVADLLLGGELLEAGGDRCRCLRGHEDDVAASPDREQD